MNPGERIREVRRSRKVTQRQLADYLGVTPSYVSHIEKGERNVSAELLYKIARYLNVRMATLMEESAPTSPFVQASRSVPDDVRPDVERCGRFHSNLWELENLVCGRPVMGTLSRLSDLPTSPKKAATEVRTLLGWSWRHVVGGHDLLRALGMHLISVFRLPLGTGIAGLSTRDAPSSIFVNTNMTPQRQIFTVAHELGHLVLHQRGVTLIERARRKLADEEQADEFATEFLMPAELLHDLAWTLPESLDRVAGIRRIAQVMGLDPMAVLFRLDQLGRVSRNTLLDARKVMAPATPEPVVWGTASFDPLAHLPDRYLLLARIAFDRHDVTAARLGELFAAGPDKAMEVYERLAAMDAPSEDPEFYEVSVR